jgi:type II secretion system protein G
MKKNKGFTLIELLVVIAIIGILSSVVLASLNSARQKSRDARRVSDIKQIQLALELYFDSNGVYPGVLTSLAPTYIPTVPVDPQNTGNYTYRYSGLRVGSGTTCATYHLRATLEDTGHQALNSDGPDTTAAGTLCTGSTVTDELGTDPIYDVRP